MATNTSETKGRIAFLHPDLGIGGAERLIVDAAIALQDRGYEVTIVTGYHDKKRAFPETTDGTLKIVPVGTYIPRSIFGSCVALCAYFKMILAALYLRLFSGISPQVVICDQISACIPFLRIINIRPFRAPKIMFYCHFPDQLLTTRQSLVKKLYRYPFDYLEEYTTGLADHVVVNSEFTKKVFKDTFKRLKTTEPGVLYPSINTGYFDEVMEETADDCDFDLPPSRYLFVSVNRFEPKKDISLAIRSLNHLRTCLSSREWDEVHLVLAGGFDPRLISSVNYLTELKNLVTTERVETHVSFVLSPPNNIKVGLLSRSAALVYTPSFEHFGIVPLEAMYMSKPVIAVDSGGPRETVDNEVTGFLCPPIESHFAVSMARLIKNPALITRMGRAGRVRFQKLFSFSKFGDAWDKIIQELIHDNANSTSKED